LGPGEENEVEAPLQVVGLETSADGGGDLEGGLAERNRCEWDGSRGYEANCLALLALSL
jgi:hypothetical protein